MTKLDYKEFNSEQLVHVFTISKNSFVNSWVWNSLEEHIQL